VSRNEDEIEAHLAEVNPEDDFLLIFSTAGARCRTETWNGGLPEMTAAILEILDAFAEMAELQPWSRCRKQVFQIPIRCAKAVIERIVTEVEAPAARQEKPH